MRHIEFGRGYFFIVDLQQGIVRQQMAQAAGFGDSGAIMQDL